MAVFTVVSPDELDRWLSARFTVGPVTAFTPIAQGIENTNYFVDTESGRFVLTLLERMTPAAVAFPLALMKYLATHGIRCPEPLAAADGSLWAMLCGKPATLATRLPGRQHDAPTAAECAAVGGLLARMHLAAAGFREAAPPNPRGLDWWPRGAADVSVLLDDGARRLLDDEIATQRAFAASAAGRSLPRSAVHADLFRDNVLFDADGQPGAIDFYFACEDRWLFDLAVSCNDWCLADRWNAGDDDGPGPLDAVRLAALLRGYSAVRKLMPAERAAFATLLRAAALRFWLSRLHDQAMPRAARLLEAKDPRPFERLLRAHRSRPLRFEAAAQGATPGKP